MLKCSFPGSFAIAWVSGGDLKYPLNVDFFLKKVIFFFKMQGLYDFVMQGRE